MNLKCKKNWIFGLKEKWWDLKRNERKIYKNLEVMWLVWLIFYFFLIDKNIRL